MGKKMCGLNVSLADEATAQFIKTIIGFEAARRSLSHGQTLELLVKKAADVESYPDEVRTRLDEISERRRSRAVVDSLAVAARTRIA